MLLRIFRLGFVYAALLGMIATAGAKFALAAPTTRPTTHRTSADRRHRAAQRRRTRSHRYGRPRSHRPRHWTTPSSRSAANVAGHTTAKGHTAATVPGHTAASTVPGPTAAAAASTPGGERLRFGVYPWAAPGAVSSVDRQRADDPQAALGAVKQLQGSRSMTVHLYGQYTGADPGEADAAISDARWWSENGVRVEMVLRYRPASSQLHAGYLPWVRAISARLAAIPGVAAIQIGNEANNDSSPAAGDGAYPGAIDAVAQGVAAARQAVVAAGRPDIGIGFNWAAGRSPCRPDSFFARLRQAGGAAFVDSVGWVGLDVYPGTWSTPTPTNDPTANLIDTTTERSLGCLRQTQMPQASLPRTVTITVAETGYPTDAARSGASQASVLRAIIGSVQRASRSYNVTDLRWFSLRDANTGSGQLENGYGLMRDDYQPKPAFAAYQQIVAAGGA